VAALKAPTTGEAASEYPGCTLWLVDLTSGDNVVAKTLMPEVLGRRLMASLLTAQHRMGDAL
jgi:hypothetical protein